MEEDLLRGDTSLSMDICADNLPLSDFLRAGEDGCEERFSVEECCGGYSSF